MTAVVQYVNAPNGVAHTVDTVRRMAKLASEGSHTYAIRSLATKITHKVPSKDVRGELAAIYTWVRDHIRYRFDPRGLEWIQAPERTIKERAGDCDDLAILIASLVQTLGHRTRFRTVGKTDNRQSHVHAQAWDGSAWIDLDPVLEPMQQTTKPRRDLGAFGHQAPGAQRLYTQEGQPMGKPSNGAIKLWTPTNFESAPQRKPQIAGIYRSRGSAGKPTPIRVSTWVNPYDPSDMGAALGFNFLKAIGSVAKVASAVGIPGAGAISAGIDIGSKFLPSGKKATPVSAPGAVITPGVGPTGGNYSTAQQINLAPIVAAALKSSDAAIAAMSAQNRQAIQAIASIATAQRATPRPAVVKKKKRAPARRQRWDAKSRRWIVYEAQPMGAYKPSITLSLLGAASPERARVLATKAAGTIAARGMQYDRRIVADFQEAAGLKRDGIYGGGTAGALRYYLGHRPPRPLFKPYTERAYTPETGMAPSSTPSAPTFAPFVTTTARDPMSPAPMAPAPAPSFPITFPMITSPGSATPPTPAPGASAAPRRRRRRAPSIPASPAVYAPIASSPRDPGLPMFPGDGGPGGKPAAQAAAPDSSNKTALILAGLYWWSTRKKRQTNGRSRR